MPPRLWPERVADILGAIANIEGYVAGLEFEQLSANKQAVHAVLYNIGILGEAVSALPDDLKARHPDIPWRDIRNMRNVVTHVYFGVDLQRVWDVTQHRLAPLREQLERLLQAEGGREAEADH